MAATKVSVIGMGYIGLPTASLLATRGYRVHGVDTNPKAVETINEGRIHIHEPDLDVLVRAAVHSGNLRADTQPAPAEIFIIAVPTPIKDDHSADVSYVEKAARAIAPQLQPGNLVVLESTSPVGTTEKVCEWIAEERPDLCLPSRTGDLPVDSEGARIFVAHCPERVLPGQILRELVDNDRVVGGIDGPSTEKAVAFYRTFTTGTILSTDSRTAELCKLCENAFRDLNIAFANELSLLCEEFDINVWTLISLANRHPRVNILQPGPGVGGHCIAVDPWFIVASSPERARLIRTAREVNDEKPRHVIEKVKAQAERFRDPVIACLGLAFKADIDDLRESPSVEIVEALAREGVGTILAVEPHIAELPPALADAGVELCGLGPAVQRADIVLLLVNHRAFDRVDKAVLQTKSVIDTRGVWG